MVKWALLILVVAFFGLGVYLYNYLGVDIKVTLNQETRGELHLVFKEHLGPYYKINDDLKLMEAWARENKLDCSRTFGEFLDDPLQVEEDRLRARVGCVLPASTTVALPPGTQSGTRPSGDYVVGQFEGSPAIGPYMVYPKAIKYIETHGLKSRGPVMEIYRVFSNTIQVEYLFPVTSATHP